MTQKIFKKTSYTVQDILDAGITLEPLRCVHCGHIGEISYSQYIGDGLCEMCREWQIGKDCSEDTKN